METLILGNAGYWTDETLKEAFPEDDIVLCLKGEEGGKKGKIIRLDVGVMDEKLERVFSTYAFDRVVFISKFVTKDSVSTGEVEELRHVLSLSQLFKVKQVVYITSDDAIIDIDNSASIIYETAEKICSYYAHNYLMEVKIIYTPYLTSTSYKDDYWNGIISMLEKKQSVEIHAHPDETAYFLSMQDLARFMVRLFENWNLNRHDGADPLFETIYLKSNCKTKYSDIAWVLRQNYPDSKILLSRNHKKRGIEYHRDKAREDYGWFARVDACDNFEHYIEEYRQNFYIKPTFHEKLRMTVHLNSTVMIILELIVGGILVELYNNLAGASVQFRMIDVRLIFVVIMSSAYGTGVGLVTALMEIASLTAAYYRQGRNGLLIFYDPGNWIPFILLLVMAAICGYVKQKSESDKQFINEENEALKSENAFITTLYKEAMEYKNQYKQDLIGSRDGFGRIFDVVSRLSATVPEQIFAEAIPAMEDVLNNRTIAIYTINDANARFARLNVASQSIRPTLANSLLLEDYSDVIEAVNRDDIWFNSDLDPDLPMYATGIKSDGAVRVLIMVYRVGYTQVSTYFSNLIKILGGLMENFILKAWEYQKALSEETFIEGTSITRMEYFRKQLDIQRDMAENSLSTFRLFRILSEGRDLVALDDIFRSQVRNNDVLGLGEDGNIYLLAVQIDDDSQEIVLRRFREMGLTCDIVEDVA